MEDSSFGTVSVPIIGDSNPAVLYRAAVRPLRVVVRNTGGTAVLLAYESAALSNLGTAGTYLLPAGKSDTFVIMPKQSMLAASVGAAGQVSIAVSTAIPFSQGD